MKLGAALGSACSRSVRAGGGGTSSQHGPLGRRAADRNRAGTRTAGSDARGERIWRNAIPLLGCTLSSNTPACAVVCVRRGISSPSHVMKPSTGGAAASAQTAQPPVFMLVRDLLRQATRDAPPSARARRPGWGGSLVVSYCFLSPVYSSSWSSAPRLGAPPRAVEPPHGGSTQ